MPLMLLPLVILGIVAILSPRAFIVMLIAFVVIRLTVPRTWPKNRS